MHDQEDQPPRLKIGSLFSGYGGLDLAVEHVFNAETVWLSELNQPVAAVFSHHWPGVPNLGDIATINWHDVEPVDILIGGFPCQDVSTVGKRAGLAPGTRSGLWAHMAEAIDALQPEWVVIENVRGLLSSPAIRLPAEGDHREPRNPGDATPDDATLRELEPDPWHLGDNAARPLRALGAVLGDLADCLASGIVSHLSGLIRQHRWGLADLKVRRVDVCYEQGCRTGCGGSAAAGEEVLGAVGEVRDLVAAGSW